MSILANYSTRLFLFCFLLAGINAIWPSQARAEWYKDEQAIMGTVVRVELWAEDPDKAQKAIQAVMDEMRHIDDTMSPYKPESELSRINQKAADEKLVISKELFGLIRTSLKFSELTHGAFDITFASVGRFYDFRKHLRPNAEEIKANLPKISYRHVILDDAHKTIHFSMEGVYIDLGGIAKGWAVDQAAERLGTWGPALVDAGGDIRAMGTPQGEPWPIAVQDPLNAARDLETLALAGGAVATSSVGGRRWLRHGRTMHHLIDPRTGEPGRSDLHTVTVVGPSAVRTEVAAKVALILGRREGTHYLEERRLAGLLVGHDGSIRTVGHLPLDQRVFDTIETQGQKENILA